MNNAIVCVKLFFLLVAAIIVTIIGIAAFLPYAIFRICKTLHGVIESKVEEIKLEIY